MLLNPAYASGGMHTIAACHACKQALLLATLCVRCVEC